MEARNLAKHKREERRHDLMIVIGQLARLATRMSEMD
jgi:hypothetical protein